MPNRSLQLQVLTPAPDLTFIDNLPRAVTPTYLEEVRADGGGSFQLSTTDPRVVENANILKGRNVVQCLVNGTVEGAWVLRQREEILVGSGEQASKYYEFSGPGLRSWLADAVVYPIITPNETKKLSEYRYFNFSGPSTGSWYNSSDWVAVVEQSTYGDTTAWNTTDGTGNPWQTAPVGWPDAPNAKWIWDRNTRLAATAPVGDVYFRREFTTTTAASYALFATVDDEFQAFIDGIPLLAINSKNSWTALWRGDIDLPAGDHVLAIKGTNTGGPAGLIAALFSYQDPKNETAAELVAYTGDDGTWLCNAYPDSVPGYTAGEIVKIFFDEAKARATAASQTTALSAITLDFTDTHDSNGDPWETVLDWAFEIGSKYSEMMQSLEDLAVEWCIDPATFKLKMYNARGSDRSVQNGTVPPVVLRPGQNVTAASEELEYDIENVLLLEHGDQLLTEVVDPMSTATTYGRIESYMSADQEMSKERALFAANKYLEISSLPVEGATISIIDVEDSVPWHDFSTGDQILGPTRNSGMTSRRVIGIAVTANETNGTPSYEVTLDTLIQQRVDRIEKLLARVPKWQTIGQQVGGSGGGGGGISDPFSGGGYSGGGGYDSGYYGGDIGSGYYGGGGGGGAVTTSTEDPGGPVGSLWYNPESTIY